MNADIFDQVDHTPTEEEKSNFSGDIFEHTKLPKEPEEGFFKDLARTALQIPKGIAQATGPGMLTNAISFLASGEALDPEEIEHIKMISEREGIPFDEEKYMEAVRMAQETFPTVSNASRELERITGVPLEAKTTLQRGVEFGSAVASGAPSGTTFRGIDTVVPRAALGVGLTGVRQGLIESGMPEPVADLLAPLILKQAPKGAAEISVGPKTKPSGMKERKFEKLEKPREVSESKLQKINTSLEDDFRESFNKIRNESPVGETAEQLSKNPTFKQQGRELLDEAQKIADKLPDLLDSGDVKRDFREMMIKKEKGFAPSDYERSYNKHMQQYLDDITDQTISAGQMVEQYRKNNGALAEYFEPGASKAVNRAKRDALLDQNKMITKLMEKEFPDSELVPVFKQGNERWTKIMDAEAIDGFVNEMFKEGLNYKKMHEFFDKNGYDRIFERALGKKGYQDFDQLMKDMLTTEKPYKMLQVARKKGFEDLYRTGVGYLISPHFGAAKTTWDVAKGTYKMLTNLLLEQPQYTLVYKKAVEDLTKGNFAGAQQGFQKLEKAIGENITPNSSTAGASNRLMHINETMKAQENRPSVQAQRKSANPPTQKPKP